MRISSWSRPRLDAVMVCAAFMAFTVPQDVWALSMTPPALPVIDLDDPTTYRSYDGSGNNLSHPELGSAGTTLMRLFEADYADGVTPTGADRPNPRDISNALGGQLENQPSDKGLTALFWGWGQVVAHDITLVTQVDEPFNIPVQPGDFDGQIDEIPFDRSNYDPSTGTGPDNPRQQINSISTFIDASFVYGSDAETAGLLRRNDGSGMLWEGADGLLPTNGQLNADNDPSNDFLFMAGDIRVNEQLALTAYHTLFMREHNRLAAYIGETNPGMSDEMIFQTARAIVAAEVQAITYNEFLPILLGTEVGLAAYGGYDSSVDPRIANVFEAAAFRLGHTLLQNEFLIVGPDGSQRVELLSCFFNPACIKEFGLKDTMMGLGGQDAQIFDLHFVDGVRNQLITAPGVTVGVDLPALNIQRGRDHGIPSYNSIRAQLIAMGWIDGTGSLPQDVLDVYGDSEVDLFIGGLGEQPFGDGLVGEVLHAILMDQFSRLRAGDRFWYEREGLLDPTLVDWLNELTLSDLILWNTDLAFFQQYAFFAVDFGLRRAETVNQLSVAFYLDGMTADGLDDYALYEVGVQISASADAPGALNQLHAEPFNAFTEAGLAQVRGSLHQLDLRLADRRAGRAASSALSIDSTAGGTNDSTLSFWIAAAGRFDDINGSGGFMDYGLETLSGYLGIDAKVSENVLIGIMANGGSTDVDFDTVSADGEADSWSLALYASVSSGQWFLDLTGGYGDLNIDSTRNISFGTIQRTASADYDGGFYYLNGRTGYGFESTGGWEFTPELSLAYIEVTQDAFTETGAGNLNLSVEKQSQESLRIKGIVQISREFETGNEGSLITPYLNAGVSHEFKDDPRAIFAGLPGGGNTLFTVFGEVAARTTAVFGAGLHATMGETVSVFIDYAGEAGSGYTNHTVTGGARIHF